MSRVLLGIARHVAMEARIALAAFLKRFPNYRLAAKPNRSQRARFRGFTEMPVALR